MVKKKGGIRMLRLDHQAVLKILPDRDENAHKGDFGKILLLCGSRGYTGAAALAARGALRVGAGLVYLGVPESIYAIEADSLPAELAVTAVNLNDDTVAALRSTTRPCFGVQYIPAAPADAEDAAGFYGELVRTIKDVKAGKYNA